MPLAEIVGWTAKNVFRLLLTMNVTVPAGDVKGLPVGLSFFGRAWSEPTILRLAHAFEQTTKFRKPPQYLPTVG